MQTLLVGARLCAGEQLGWMPRRTAIEAPEKLIPGLAGGRGEPVSSFSWIGPNRVGNFATVSPLWVCFFAGLRGKTNSFCGCLRRHRFLRTYVRESNSCVVDASTE
jgi:hypothetical protein